MLIIGGTGFIGFHLCKFFLKKNIQIFSLSLSKPKKIKRLKNVTYLRADISKKKNLNILKKYNFNYFINCGGYVDHFNKVKHEPHYKGLKISLRFLGGVKFQLSYRLVAAMNMEKLALLIKKYSNVNLNLFMLDQNFWQQMFF